MDQNFSRSNSGKQGAMTVFASVLIMLFSSFTASADFARGYNEPGVTITSSGVINGEMIFRLNYENENADMLEIAISDNQGNRLYKKTLSDKKVNTIFKIPAELGTVYLTVTNTKDKTEKRFQISSQERVVEKVVIGSVR